MGVDPFEPASLNNLKLFDLLRPGDSLFLPSFALLGIDSNHGIATPSWLVGFAGPLLRSFLESGMGVWRDRQPIRVQVAWILGRDQTPSSRPGNPLASWNHSDTINALNCWSLYRNRRKD